MDDLIGDFVCEAREMLEALEGELVEWERDPDDRERLDAIFVSSIRSKAIAGFSISRASKLSPTLPRMHLAMFAAAGRSLDHSRTI